MTSRVTYFYCLPINSRVEFIFLFLYFIFKDIRSEYCLDNSKKTLYKKLALVFNRSTSNFLKSFFFFKKKTKYLVFFFSFS